MTACFSRVSRCNPQPTSSASQFCSRGEVHEVDWPDGSWLHWEDPWENLNLLGGLLCSASSSPPPGWERVLTPKVHFRICLSALPSGQRYAIHNEMCYR
ncbi:uncharacterized protein LOC451550 isoform X2 [Pan troglodytes]|uniref:uncharacterized protein LOC451550 isoform X2 n=1 Tax=Pan troglodytes TaxID=9598 RepID=UPI003013B8B7